jgi:hypothetical protein
MTDHSGQQIVILTTTWLVAAKIRDRIALNEKGSYTFHMERLNLKKLNEVNDKEKCYFEV